MILGILFGLTAGLAQTIFYLFSRSYSGGALRLLVITQIYLGVVALLALPFVTPDILPPFKTYLPNVMGGSLFFLVGQACLLRVLQRTEASRIAPLLGFKIIFVAGIGLLFFNHQISTYEWIGIACTLLGGVILNSSGKKPHPSTIPLAFGACLAYCLSDLNLNELVRAFPGISITRSTLFAASLTYIFGGITFTPFLFFVKDLKKELWIKAIPHTFIWLIAMLALFFAYAHIGVVFAVAVQSTRGIISIVLGYVIGRWRKGTLEEHLPHSVFLKRIAGALIMALGIGFFTLYGT